MCSQIGWKWSCNLSIHSVSSTNEGRPSSLCYSPYTRVKNVAVLTAICSVNCNNCDSIVKLRAGTPHLLMLNRGEMSLDWIRLVPQRNHCLFVCRKWCVDANRGGTETSNKFYANENPNENISRRNELARVNCLHFLSVWSAAWDLIFKYTNDAAQPMTLQPLEIFFCCDCEERKTSDRGRERVDIWDSTCQKPAVIVCSAPEC